MSDPDPTGADERRAQRRARTDWYAQTFDTFEAVERTDIQQSMAMDPAERLELVFVLSGQLETSSVSRSEWPVSIGRFNEVTP